MTPADRLFRAAGACLVALAALLGTPAHGQAVTNVAAARWSVGGEDFSVQSNSVTFQRSARPARLSTFVPTPEAGESIVLALSYCTSASQIAFSRGGITTAAAAATASVSVRPTNALHPGQRLVVRLDSPVSNRDSAQVETLGVRLTTEDGDVEDIEATESAENSGVFFGAIETAPTPPALSRNDCRLTLRGGETIAIEGLENGLPIAGLVGQVHALADPFGIVFSSRDGAPVDGARITIIDEATGQPARVFGYDGVSPYPATVIAGETTADAAGVAYPVDAGEYRFPLVGFGRYRLLVEPPAPFTAPSTVAPADLAGLTRPDGLPFVLTAGSYGDPFTIDTVAPLEIDLPLDSPGGQIALRKRVSRDEAEPGDALLYRLSLSNLDPALPSDPVTITDRFSASLRLAPDSVRIDGQDASALVQPDADGHGLSLALPALAPGQEREITYALTVAGEALPGQALNHAIARAGSDDPVEASVGVRIRRDGLTDRMTLIGRIAAGRCGRTEGDIGLAGVRVMLEDGSFTITDADGRYHFEGVVPGTHVVRAIGATLPAGGRFVDCARSTRTAGSADSRFVTGQGGSVVRADFTATVPEEVLADLHAEVVPAALSDRQASGAEVDWMALGDGPDEILFPAAEHNPRSPAMRVVVRHRPDVTPLLEIDGKLADPLTYEGATTNSTGAYAISIWRGVRLPGETGTLTVRLRGADGQATELTREVHFSDTPMRAELLPERSRLIADGASTPMLAVRMVDRYGRPVHAGLSGSFALEAPYQALSEREARQSQALSGFGSSAARWLIEGDDGIAYIELAPTMVSGALRATFVFSDGETSRETQVEAWMEPGEQPWTVIALAEGSIGARTVADNMERGGDFDSDLGDEARVALYAKGRILGRYLLTVSYDSAKQQEEQRLLGALDPSAYYTVYGDNTERLYDAASREKLYVRIESRSFYAMFGDFDTGFDQTELARYQRTATGVRAEAQAGGFQAQAFAAETGSRHQRVEFQGGGISGPYAIGSRTITANSEVVAIEVRDRLRSEIVVDRRELVRFVDYRIDEISGTITFSEPVLSRDPSLNPQFVVIDYESDELGNETWNAGLRTTWTGDDGNVRVGATGISDQGDAARTNLGAVDVRLRIGAGTELRGEAAVSRSEGVSSTAISAELEHHSDTIDLLAYARQVDEGFGVGQQNQAERGRRKVGADARVALDEHLSLVGSVWRDESLTDDARRNALELRAAYRKAATDAYLGVAYLDDHLADGRDRSSTVLEGGVTQRLLDQRLELSAATSIALAGTESIDLPTRHRLGARYAITPGIRAVAAYEIARGEAIDANTLQGGFELSPWNGSKVTTLLGSETLGADAQRTFASFALGQSLQITDALTLDTTLDASRTLGGGIAVTDVINPAHPVSSGGHLGQDGSLGEDFTATSFGATWQKDLWSARVRGEYRDGELADREGVTVAAIRQLGNGSVVGSGFLWTKATGIGGASSEINDASIALAHRPAGSAFSLLSKIEYRSDRVRNAVAGEETPVGPSRLTVNGDARSARVIGSVSANWTPTGASGTELGEIDLFVGLRHNLDRVGDFDLADTTALAGAQARVGLSERIEIGARATVRASLDDGTTDFALGPEIGFVPADNILLSVGYNVVGFRDPDFGAARSTERGVYAAIKVKLDESAFAFLGLNR
jgi:uncharacterized repeat protein (TIGR01451 family)